jgi:hypothetical protein
MFNKRHYEAIAKVIKPHSAKNTVDTVSDDYFVGMVLSIVDMFESDNPDFDRVRFIEACGLGIDAPEIITVS